MKPDRYLAIRIRPAQGDLFADGNRSLLCRGLQYVELARGKVLCWQPEKCGTVGKAIDVLKNDSAGGSVPCKRFLADADWFRLNVLAYNVLAVMKRQSLSSSW